MQTQTENLENRVMTTSVVNYRKFGENLSKMIEPEKVKKMCIEIGILPPYVTQQDRSEIMTGYIDGLVQNSQNPRELFEFVDLDAVKLLYQGDRTALKKRTLDILVKKDHPDKNYHNNLSTELHLDNELKEYLADAVVSIERDFAMITYIDLKKDDKVSALIEEIKKDNPVSAYGWLKNRIGDIVNANNILKEHYQSLPDEALRQFGHNIEMVKNIATMPVSKSDYGTSARVRLEAAMLYFKRGVSNNRWESDSLKRDATLQESEKIIKDAAVEAINSGNINALNGFSYHTVQFELAKYNVHQDPGKAIDFFISNGYDGPELWQAVGNYPQNKVPDNNRKIVSWGPTVLNKLAELTFESNLHDSYWYKKWAGAKPEEFNAYFNERSNPKSKNYSAIEAYNLYFEAEIDNPSLIKKLRDEVCNDKWKDKSYISDHHIDKRDSTAMETVIEQLDRNKPSHLKKMWEIAVKVDDQKSRLEVEGWYIDSFSHSAYNFFNRLSQNSDSTLEQCIKEATLAIEPKENALKRIAEDSGVPLEMYKVS